MPSKLIETTRHETLNNFRVNTNEVAVAVANSIQSDEFLSAGNILHGWNVSVSGGTPEQPQYITWSKGTSRVRMELTWGTVGGAAGNVTQCVVSLSEDSGSTWNIFKGIDTDGEDLLTNGIFALSYDSNGNFTTGIWS